MRGYVEYIESATYYGGDTSPEGFAEHLRGAEEGVDAHSTSVSHRRAGLYAGDERDEYLAICASCGQVGQPQSREADALAIAERHAAVGGFEGRS
jgi:hypothetical protein